jgi:hypothetical protein
MPGPRLRDGVGIKKQPITNAQLSNEVRAKIRIVQTGIKKLVEQQWSAKTSESRKH